MDSGESDDIGLMCCQLNRMEVVRIRLIIHPSLSKGVSRGSCLQSCVVSSSRVVYSDDQIKLYGIIRSNYLCKVPWYWVLSRK